MDKELKGRDGEDHVFYARFNKLSDIKHVVIVYEGPAAVGCGAIREFSKDSMEVKRMFVPPLKRGHGIGAIVLAELETWAKELGYKKCILETGKRQPEAISLYQKNGYTIIPNFGQYKDDLNSVCFEKTIYQPGPH